ncbi:LOW QUALITY PROTEIN: DNA replication licensing factor REC [Drosophila eugracilis]|uniref:LOW QUALITY PROTEIN: DNA replication licensing factor REC n=1 Tax=Drosophila eugracilis TaxID=29029 RepID=UPI001BDA593B|nr:LOW QUALITY PROTEIN: DNA replication licensing factor REC [Drosophila eugracilis]
MNPPPSRGRAPSRFVRGRGRGGGPYRPYFYFRRNGRVIPARGNRQPNREESGAPGGSGDDPPASRQPRGWNRTTSKRGRDVHLDCSFLRPENYAAPEDGLQVPSIAVDNPRAHSGWRLYFLRDNYEEGNELARRIMAVSAHYQRNPHNYDFMMIRDRGFFPLLALTILSDVQLMEAWPSLSDDIREHPLRTLATLSLAMHTVVVNHVLDCNDSSASVVSTPEQYIPPTTRLRKIYVRPIDFVKVDNMEGITHSRVDTLLSIRGTVTSVGEPSYSLTWQAFRCSRCQMEIAMRQRGTFQPRPYQCKRSECVARDEFLPLRNSPYTRLSIRQIIRLEESSLTSVHDFESSVAGEIDVELRHDLVDSIRVGQEVIIAGVLKLQELGEDTSAGDASNQMQAYLKAVSIQDAAGIKREFSDRDLEAIAMINAESNSFKLLVQSIAPEVYGHELPKAACLLSLLGGKGAEDEAINILLVGDPGIGKTKILQSCAQITERGAHVSGKRGTQSAQQLGVTFVGRNKRVLQAGALMTAGGGGHCTLDDVDKLASKQAVLLQCLQSGEMNIPLPGAFASFPTQPTVIACANPQRGQYDEGRYLLQNINITPALLRKFHLVYVLLDKPSERDMSLTAHVRALHAGAKKRARIAARYAMKPKMSDSMCEATFHVPGTGEKDSIKTEDDNDSVMQQDYDLDKRLELLPEDSDMDLLPPILIKKFLAYARQEVSPLLNEEASNAILRFFLELQGSSGQDEGDHSQIGAGQLLGLIHLSQARARLDLSHVVSTQHVRDVIALLTESITQTSLKADSRGSEVRRGGGGGGKSAQLRNFVHLLQKRSAALGRRIFEFDELKEIGTRAGILTGFNQLVEMANLGGYLLMKGANMYEVVPD